MTITVQLLDDATGNVLGLGTLPVVPRQSEWLVHNKELLYVKWVVYGPASDQVRLIVKRGERPETNATIL